MEYICEKPYTFHYCVILSERSESKNLLRIKFLLPERSFAFPQNETCGLHMG